MAAIIQFPDGVKATLLGERGKWSSEDAALAERLEELTIFIQNNVWYDRQPQPVLALAEFVAEKVGAIVIHFDPPPPPMVSDGEF